MSIHFRFDWGAKVLGAPFYVIASRRVKESLNGHKTDGCRAIRKNNFKKLISRFQNWCFRGGCGAVLTCLGYLVSCAFGFWVARIQQGTGSLADPKGEWAQFAVLYLSFFLFLLLGAWWIQLRVYQPLAKLRRYLDEVNREKGKFQRLPDSGGLLPEMEQVFESIERLLEQVKADRDVKSLELLREKRRSDVISEAILDGIILLRGDELCYLNSIGAKILGIPSPREVRGVKLNNSEICLRPEGVAAVKEAMGCVLPVELTLTVNNRKFYYLLQTVPLSGALIESAKLTSNVDCDGVLDLIYADTLVLANDVTLLRESQEAKGHFLATISHEIKTPVTTLTLATRLLKKSISQIPNLNHRELINICVDNVDRLRGLLEDLLTTSRLEPINQKLELQFVDFRNLLRNTVNSYMDEAERKGIHLFFQMNNKAKLMIEVDAGKITWAVSNLLINALLHTPKDGKVSVIVESKQEFILVQIRDTGPGIESSRQESIFEKFSSYYNLRVARSGGAGLGLAIAREIVVAHGGRIWVSSRPGFGSEFSFIIPFKIPKPVSVGTSTKQVINENGNLKFQQS